MRCTNPTTTSDTTHLATSPLSCFKKASTVAALGVRSGKDANDAQLTQISSFTVFRYSYIGKDAKDAQLTQDLVIHCV